MKLAIPILRAGACPIWLSIVHSFVPTDPVARYASCANMCTFVNAMCSIHQTIRFQDPKSIGSRRGRVAATRSYSSLILQNPSITLERDIRIKLLSLCNDSMNASLCDATFQVGEDRQIFHVISALFAIHSPELNRLLQHKHHNKHEIIPLYDITADSFAFLRYVLH